MSKQTKSRELELSFKQKYASYCLNVSKFCIIRKKNVAADSQMWRAEN